MRLAPALCSALLLLLAGHTAAEAREAWLPASVARYQITRAKLVERLDIVRTPDRVEHHFLDRGLVEVWQRSARGELEHWKIFPAAKRAVHYTAGDLRTVHIEPSWEQLATLIGAEERAQLKEDGSKPRIGQGVRVLHGTLEGRPARVAWNEQASWAAEIVLGNARERTRYLLTAMDACSDSTCAPFDARGYREIEFADLGDTEHDPFVRSFLASFAHGHAH